MKINKLSLNEKILNFDNALIYYSVYYRLSYFGTLGFCREQGANFFHPNGSSFLPEDQI